ncbi:MAG: tRNA pseudouridine(55) synthase, partial [bacterium]
LEIFPDGFRCKVICSGGTYIRSLARDIGERLGCGGFLKGLIRTRVGNFTLDQSLSLDDILTEAKKLTRA